jgi:hypothetical protein
MSRPGNAARGKSSTTMPKPLKKDGELMYEIDEVLDVRMGKYGPEHLVSWKGYSSEDDLWIDELPPFFQKGHVLYQKKTAQRAFKKFNGKNDDIDVDYDTTESGSEDESEVESDEYDDTSDDEEIYDASEDEEIDDDDEEFSNVVKATISVDSAIKSAKKASCNAKKACAIMSTKKASSNCKKACAFTSKTTTTAKKTTAIAKKTAAIAKKTTAIAKKSTIRVKTAPVRTKTTPPVRVKKTTTARSKEPMDTQFDVPKRLSFGPCPGCRPGVPPTKLSKATCDALRVAYYPIFYT